MVQIREEAILEPVRLEGLLTLISAHEDSWDDDDKYGSHFYFTLSLPVCLKDRILVDGDKGQAAALRYCLADELQWDVFACLLGWVNKAPLLRERCSALLALKTLLDSGMSHLTVLFF